MARRTGLRLWIWWVVLLIAAGCASRGALPPEAQTALDEAARAYYRDASYGGAVFDEVEEVRVVRARQAESDGPGAGGALWCVDLAVTGVRDGVRARTEALWIVAAGGTASSPEWAAAALETISASITHEHCGQQAP